MTAILSLDARTLVVANLMMSVAILMLLLITRFGLGRAGHRLNLWIGGECVFLSSRLIYPLTWTTDAGDWKSLMPRCIPPLIITGLLIHVLGLRQAQGRVNGSRTLLLTGLLVLVVCAAALSLDDDLLMDVFMGSLAATWAWTLLETLSLVSTSWGARGLAALATIVMTSNLLLLASGQGHFHNLLNSAGLLIEMLVMLVSTTCFLLWVQEELRKDLSEIAVTDALTGVLNRHGLLPWLEIKLAQAKMDGHPLSIALCDLDHFKKVNDEHGHAAGDEVLRRFAHGARATLRRNDRFGRWGGEEFLFVLPDTALSDAERIVDRLREMRPAAHQRERGGASHVVTFSAGVACSSENNGAISIDDLLEKADRRMYLAKQRRDCIVAVDAPSPVATDGLTLVSALHALE
jgi:diguanylate cyclase (GGDEF)-like protein